MSFKLPPSCLWLTGTVAMQGTGGAVRVIPSDLVTLWAVVPILPFSWHWHLPGV
jgi:hypothetical protein